MRIYECRHCGARNRSTGQCVKCLKGLGSLPRAFVAAGVAATILAVLWGAFSWITHLQATFLALGFGVTISAVAAHFSGGRGFLYQVVASGWTLLGMLAGDTLAVWLLWPQFYPRTPDRPDFLALMQWLALWDGATIGLMALGLMGGMFLWHQSDGVSGI